LSISVKWPVAALAMAVSAGAWAENSPGGTRDGGRPDGPASTSQGSPAGTSAQAGERKSDRGSSRKARKKRDKDARPAGEGGEKQPAKPCEEVKPCAIE
jgi:hypothetical protein